MAVKFRKTKDENTEEDAKTEDANGYSVNFRSSVEASVQDGDFREVR